MTSTRPAPGSADAGPTRAERVGLALLGGFTAFALFGYATFALRPQNLALVPFAAGFFGISFKFFAQLHIVLSFVVLAAVLWTRTGWRWLPAMLATSAVAFTAEHAGTGYGIPFGGYEYTSLLGIRIGPRVPALIPVSWFLMALPSWLIAKHVFGTRRAPRVVLGALALVLWDLALDPAMSSLTSYWVWHETGPYYGMPWMNLVGWFVTGAALMAVLEVLGRDGRFDPVPVRLMVLYWVLVLLMPLGMLVAAASWLGVLTTLAATGLTAVVAFSIRTTRAGPSGTGLDPTAVPTPAGTP